jgi:hypothetical protein
VGLTRELRVQDQATGLGEGDDEQRRGEHDHAEPGDGRGMPSAKRPRQPAIPPRIEAFMIQATAVARTPVGNNSARCAAKAGAKANAPRLEASTPAAISQPPSMR